MSDKVEALEVERDALKGELRVAQEILFHVLQQHGEPVEIPGEVLKAGISKDRLIDLTYAEDIDSWVVRIVVLPSE